MASLKYLIVVVKELLCINNGLTYVSEGHLWMSAGSVQLSHTETLHRLNKNGNHLWVLLCEGIKVMSIYYVSCIQSIY